jgi:hypothetical protein
MYRTENSERLGATAARPKAALSKVHSRAEKVSSSGRGHTTRSDV